MKASDLNELKERVKSALMICFEQDGQCRKCPYTGYRGCIVDFRKEALELIEKYESLVDPRL